MSENTALRCLARRLGIETGYIDASGTEQHAADDAILSLIAAFGLPPDPAAAEAIVAEQERSRPFGLDPMQIVAAENPLPGLDVQLPAGVSAVEWHCQLETGEERSGRTAAHPDARVDRSQAWLALPAGLPQGYHRLDLSAGSLQAQTGLAVAPPACYLSPEIAPGARRWGLTTQLYGLRSARNWGMGDFTDLAALSRSAGSFGAAVLGLNPLHALFAAEPRHVSPYSPSSRLHLDYLYIDVTAVCGFAEDEAARALVRGETLQAARGGRLVDYRAVAALKRPVLEALFRRFMQRDLTPAGSPLSERGRSFRSFQQAGGAALARFAAFEALHEHFLGEGRSFSWRAWPEPMRDPRSAAVAEFVRVHHDRVVFFQFLQWEADRQLAAAAEAGRASGLSIGLYRDLAVGVDPQGAEAWEDQELVAPGAAIGAPPDDLSRAGQNWGLAPVNPRVLKRHGYAPFIGSLRANMRHAGVLRLDHVMSLKRLYWIPSGQSATDGIYVEYPFEALLRLVALESHRQNCTVIGEDLGTVPKGFRETMARAKVLSYRVFAFERENDRHFLPPGEYPALAAASAATHDVATLKGFWLGRDIAWRRKLDLYPDAAAETAERAARQTDRQLLLQALAAEGLLAPAPLRECLSPAGEPRFTVALRDAILAFLARSRSRLMLVQLEDVACEREQANLPGTTDAHPNWRRRISSRLEEILGGGDLQRVAMVIEEGRRYSAGRPRSA